MSIEERLFAPDKDGWKEWGRPGDHFMRFIGTFWRKEREGGAIFGFLFDKRHENVVGTAHGGVLLALADHGLGMICHEANQAPMVTVDIAVQFIGAARIGQFIEISGHVLREGKTIVFVRGSGTCDGQIVFNASATLMIVKPAQGVVARLEGVTASLVHPTQSES